MKDKYDGKKYQLHESIHKYEKVGRARVSKMRRQIKKNAKCMNGWTKEKGNKKRRKKERRKKRRYNKMQLKPATRGVMATREIFLSKDYREGYGERLPETICG